MLERTSRPAHDASSHGSARIFRYAYPDAFYTQAVLDSKALWDGLAAGAGTELISPVGAVDYGPDAAARTAWPGSWPGRGVEHELLTAAEARSRWPQLAFDTDGPVAPRRRRHRRRKRRQRNGGAGPRERRRGADRLGRERRGSLGSGRRVPAGIGHGGDVRRRQRDHQCRRLAAAAARGPCRCRPGSWPGCRNSRSARSRPTTSATAGPRRLRSAWPTFIHKSAEIQVYGLPGGRDAGFAGQKVAEYNGGNR